MIINLSRIDFGGITGGKTKPEEVFDVQPTTSDQTITPTEGSVFSGGTVHAVTSSIDSNIQPENIKEGVSILGVAGTLSGGGSPASIYDGSFDEDGLRAIGWTDEDIDLFKEANPHFAWQNDQYIVSEENKALYLLDDPNPSSYKDNPNITFVPNKNMESYFAKSSGFEGMKYIKGIPFYSTSGITAAIHLFDGCTNLTAIPNLDLSNITSGTAVFKNCQALTAIPNLNISNISSMYEMFSGCSNLKNIPPLSTQKVTNAYYLFYGCKNLTTIPNLDLSNVTNAFGLFYNCEGLTNIPPLDLSKAVDVTSMFLNCEKLTNIPRLNTVNVTRMNNIFGNCHGTTTVEGIDFSGLTSSPRALFGYNSDFPKLTHFIVNGKINVSISDDYSFKVLNKIDYDSVKSILAAADRTDNTNAKELAFRRTMTDQNGELAALVASCTSKGWTITGLTLQ